MHIPIVQSEEDVARVFVREERGDHGVQMWGGSQGRNHTLRGNSKVRLESEGCAWLV